MKHAICKFGGGINLRQILVMLLSFMITLSCCSNLVYADSSTIASRGTEVADINDAATVIPSDYQLYGLQNTLQQLDLSYDNATVTVYDSNIHYTDSIGTGLVGYYWESTSNSATTLTNPMKIDFANVAEYNGRSVNATMTVNSIYFGELVSWSKNTDYCLLITFLNSGTLGMGLGDGADNLRQAREIIIDYSIELNWADNGYDFDYNFYQLITDLDMGSHDGFSWFFRESFEGYDSYFSDYFVTDEYRMLVKKTSDTTIFAANGQGNTNNPDSYNQTGVLAATNSNEFRAKIYCTAGLCGNDMTLYIDDFGDSLTKEESISTYKSYDDATAISYDITYAMPEFYVDTFNLYDELSIYDTLPGGVTYTSAKVIDKSTNTDITNKGTLSYDSGSNKVTFTFSNDYISDMTNYAGQNITITITGTVSGTASYDNTAYASVSGVEINSNTVTVDPLYKITTEVVNGTIDDDVTEIASGSDETISYTPDSGYTIKSITVDGTSVSIDTYADEYEFTDIDANHTIKVVYAPSARTITIIKKVLKSDINYSNGTPTFVFHLEGTDVNGGTYSYNQIASMDESLTADSDGYISVSCTFNVTAGTYKSTEMLCSRYEFDSTESLVNATASGSTVTYDVKTNTSASATYINEITNFGGFSDATSVINNCGSTN